MKAEVIIAAAIVVTIFLLIIFDYIEERKDNKK
jgi:hypothetical protein